MEENPHFDTQAIRTQTLRSHNNEHSAPIYLSSSFIFENAESMRAAFNDESDDLIYSRYANPNTNELVQKICLLEGAEAGIATASGMAAIFTSFAALLNASDHIISCSSVFGATHTLLNKYFKKWNINYSYFDAQNPREIENLIQPNTKIVYLETPTNPAIDIIDLELVGDICKKNGLILIIDNCFATPYLQRPIAYGADLVIHSATKYIDGQGRTLGGLVVGRADLIKEIYLFGRISGPSLSPFNAWTLSKSLETLALRMERHSQNALYIAQNLENHSSIEFIKYPFLRSHPQYLIAQKQMKMGGGIISFSMKQGYNAAVKMMNALKMIKISANLGDSRSIVTHPASSTHCKLSELERMAVGITPGLVRISVGLENQDDILNDILQALDS